MNLMDVFRSSIGNRNQPTQQTQAQQGGQQQTVQPSAQPGGQNNLANASVKSQPPGVTGSRTQTDSGVPNNLDQKAAPLDEFKDLWNPPEPEGGKRPDNSKFSRPKLDQNKLGEGFGKMSFTQGLDPNKIQKALGGDAESFMEILEHTARRAAMTSFQASESYNGRLLDTYDQSVNARIPKQISEFETRSAVRNTIKGMDHPAVSPWLDSLQSQFRERFPDASPQEIAQAAQRYLQEAAKVITGQSESDSNNESEFGNQRQNRNSSIVDDFTDFELAPQQRQSQQDRR